MCSNSLKYFANKGKAFLFKALHVCLLCCFMGSLGHSTLFISDDYLSNPLPESTLGYMPEAFQEIQHAASYVFEQGNQVLSEMNRYVKQHPITMIWILITMFFVTVSADSSFPDDKINSWLVSEERACELLFPAPHSTPYQPLLNTSFDNLNQEDLPHATQILTSFQENLHDFLPALAKGGVDNLATMLEETVFLYLCMQRDFLEKFNHCFQFCTKIDEKGNIFCGKNGECQRIVESPGGDLEALWNFEKERLNILIKDLKPLPSTPEWLIYHIKDALAATIRLARRFNISIIQQCLSKAFAICQIGDCQTKQLKEFVRSYARQDL